MFLSSTAAGGETWFTDQARLNGDYCWDIEIFNTFKHILIKTKNKKTKYFTIIFASHAKSCIDTL